LKASPTTRQSAPTKTPRNGGGGLSEFGLDHGGVRGPHAHARSTPRRALDPSDVTGMLLNGWFQQQAGQLDAAQAATRA